MADGKNNQTLMGTPEELHQLAVALDEFAEGYDTYEYRDNIEDKEGPTLSGTVFDGTGHRQYPWLSAGFC